MSSNPLDKLLRPRLPPCAVGVEQGAASVVQLDRARGGYIIKRAAIVDLAAILLAPAALFTSSRTATSLIVEPVLSFTDDKKFSSFEIDLDFATTIAFLDDLSLAIADANESGLFKGADALGSFAGLE